MAVRTNGNGIRIFTGVVNHSGPYTIMFGVRYRATAGEGLFSANIDVSSSNEDSLIVVSGGNLQLVAAGGSGGSSNVNLDPATEADAEDIQHVAVVRESATVLKVYVNAVLFATVTANVAARGASNMLGLFWRDGFDGCDVDVCAVKIWNGVAFTGAEIAEEIPWRNPQNYVEAARLTLPMLSGGTWLTPRIKDFANTIFDSSGPDPETTADPAWLLGDDPDPEPPGEPELSIDEQPTATQSGYLIDPAPVVHVLDAEGALDTSFTGDVTASLIGSGGVLLGTLTVAAVAGVATFANLRPCEAGSYQLRFGAAGYADLDSAVFAVTAGEGSTNVIVHQEAPMRPIRRNEPTAALRDIPITILADDGSPWDGDPDAGGGVKAMLSQNFGAEDPSPANIVKLSAGNFRVRPTDAYTDIVEGSIIKARVPAAAGRREAVGWAHIIPADTYVSADAARKALVDAVIIASDGGGGYDVVKQPESNQIQRTIPGVGVVTITAVFSPSVPGIVSAGGS